jgi:hypothetical protein
MKAGIMRRARKVWFCGLVAALVVVGVEGVAWATDGQPLIVGSDNSATQPTTLGGNFVAQNLFAQTVQGNLQGGTLTLSGRAEGGSADVVVFAPGQTTRTLTVPRPTDAASSKGDAADYPVVQLLGRHPGLRVMADTSPHTNPFTHQSNPVKLTIWLSQPAKVPVTVLYVIVGISND